MNAFSKFLILLFITFTYGVIYSTMEDKHFNFTSKIDPYYFSFTTATSVGYGDISPKTTKSKLIVMSQQLLILTGETILMVEFMKQYIKKKIY